MSTFFTHCNNNLDILITIMYYKNYQEAEMAITKDDVKYAANLARLKMTEEELENFTGNLDDILEYVKKLEKLDTKNVKPTSHILDINNVSRKDELTNESLSNEEAMKMAPEPDDGFFKVPKVIE